MATAVDTTSTAVATGGVASLTWPHTTNASGAFRYGVATVCTNGTIPSGVTYAGQPLALIGSQQESQTGHRVSMWGIAQPGTGTNNVVVTMASASSPLACGFTTATGVDQVSSYGTFVGTSAPLDTNPSTTVPSDADELVICGLVWNNQSGAALSTPDASQTFQWKQEGGNFVRGAGSTKQPGAASVNVSYTMSVATNYAFCGVSLKSVAQPSKGTISRVVIPIAHGRAMRYALATQGWQCTPVFDAPTTVPNEFFCGNYLG